MAAAVAAGGDGPQPGLFHPQKCVFSLVRQRVPKRARARRGGGGGELEVRRESVMLVLFLLALMSRRPSFTQASCCGHGLSNFKDDNKPTREQHELVAWTRHESAPFPCSSSQVQTSNVSSCFFLELSRKIKVSMLRSRYGSRAITSDDKASHARKRPQDLSDWQP